VAGGGAAFGVIYGQGEQMKRMKLIDAGLLNVR
jgi:hypothetical protein